MKTVGSRRVDGAPLPDQGRLARSAAALHPGGMAEAGVYRFRSFEDAEWWNPKTSPASAAP